MTSHGFRPPHLWLSHAMSEHTPAYGGGQGFTRTAASSIAAGDSANSEAWTFPNHLGTHVDVPRHFVEGGDTVDAYGPERWWFSRPVIIDVPMGDDALIQPADIAGRVPDGTDLLILRTGFEAHRGTRRYWERNPGLSAALARHLREAYPRLRAVGMDLISVTARAHRPEGREAHRALLEHHPDSDPIILIEDMALAHASGALDAVVVAPLRVLQADGGPVTVLAWPR